MNDVSKTLYIPLYGKAFVSRKGIILSDPRAEEIWSAEGFPLRGKAASKWLAYYMAMRSAVYDAWLREQMARDTDAAVLHLGCGMDSRCVRVEHPGRLWYDIDLPEVIRERERYFASDEMYRLLSADLRQEAWLEEIGAERVIVVLEGVSMYLEPQELKRLLDRLGKRFRKVSLLMDSYTELAAKLSRRHNPINSVGVTEVYGFDDPRTVENETVRFLREKVITPPELIGQLAPMERRIFRRLYAGGLSRKLYKMYEFSAKEGDGPWN